MMDWTDRHCRFLHRLMSRHTLLYTEMVTAPALVRGGARHLLRFDAAEHPVALQLGGSDPEELAEEALALDADSGDAHAHLARALMRRRQSRGAIEHAERAVEEAFCDAADRLAATRDSYLRARAEDLRDICQVILRALVRGERAFRAPNHVHDLVMVSRQLHVSDVLRARRVGARAFITSSRATRTPGSR